MASELKKMAEGGLKFVIPLMPFDFRVRKLETTGADALKLLISKCHEYQMEVHPTFCVFFNEERAEISSIIQEHPDWGIVNRRREILPLLDPGKPEVRDFIIDRILGIARRYDIDGILLDFIRYQGDAVGDVCYCKRCRDDFKEAYGKDPLELSEDDPLMEKWDDTRRQNINTFVQSFYDKSKKVRNDLSLSAYVWARGDTKGVYQDWPVWVERKKLDWISHGCYTDDMTHFANTCRRFVSTVKNKIPAYIVICPKSSLVNPDKYELTADQIVKQMQIAKEAGVDGITFCYWYNLRPKLADVSKIIHQWSS